MLLDELVAEVAKVAEVRDEVDEGELQEELANLIITRSGSPLLEDTGTREAAELELRADGYGAARGDDDGPQVYSLPLNELQRRMADGEDAWPEVKLLTMSVLTFVLVAVALVVVLRAGVAAGGVVRRRPGRRPDRGRSDDGGRELAVAAAGRGDGEEGGGLEVVELHEASMRNDLDTPIRGMLVVVRKTLAGGPRDS